MQRMNQFFRMAVAIAAAVPYTLPQIVCGKEPGEIKRQIERDASPFGGGC